MILTYIPPIISQFLLWPIARTLLWVFCDFEVFGYEKIKKMQRGVIFAGNHTHDLDTIAVRAALPWLSKFSPIFYVAKGRRKYPSDGWRYILYNSTLFWIVGAHHTHPGMRDYSYSLKKFVDIGKAKNSICIFPFGIQKDVDLNKYKPRGGAIFLSNHLRIPIIPIYITKLSDVSFLSFFTGKLTIKITFGIPVYYHQSLPKDPSKEQYEMASINLGNRINELKIDSERGMQRARNTFAHN